MHGPPGVPQRKIPASSSFQVAITWVQFQQLLRGVTEEDGDPSAVFGPDWNNTDAWVLLRAGYGQENFNNGTTTSTIEGLFDALEVLSVSTATNSVNESTREGFVPLNAYVHRSATAPAFSGGRDDRKS